MEPLSGYEKDLIRNADVLLAKNRIIEKVGSLFSQLSDQYQDHVSGFNGIIPAHVPPKISKGEKYKGLPYLVLDYPRAFSTSEIFAIRTLFWWGNYFSITLHLQGSYVPQWAAAIRSGIHNNWFDGWYVQCQGDMWQHAMDEAYMPVSNALVTDLQTVPFIKLAKKIPLAEWDQIDSMLLLEYQKLVSLFTHQSGGKDL